MLDTLADHSKTHASEPSCYLMVVFMRAGASDSAAPHFSLLLSAPTGPVFALTGNTRPSLVAVPIGCQKIGREPKTKGIWLRICSNEVFTLTF